MCVAAHARIKCAVAHGLQVNVSMYLIGENASPVTATLSVFQRGAAGTANALLPADLVMDEALYWDVGEYGSPKTVTVSLPTQVKLRGQGTVDISSPVAVSSLPCSSAHKLRLS